MQDERPGHPRAGAVRGPQPEALRSVFLAAAAAALARPIEADETLRAVAALAVPTLADACAIETDAGGRRAVVARTGDRTALKDPAVVAAVDRVLTTGRSDLVRDSGGVSALVVQLSGRDGPIGALVLARSSDAYAPSDLVFAEDLASRAGIAYEHARAQNELRVRERLQAAVARLGREALRNRPVPQLLDEAVRLVAENLGVDYAKVLRRLPDGDLRLQAGVGWRPGLVGSATVGAGPDSQAGYTLASSAPVIVRNLRVETRFRGPPLLREHDVISGLSVIIAGEDGAYGVLGAHTVRERTFTERDVDFLQSIANVLAEAMLRRRSEERNRELVQTLERRVRERSAELETMNRELEAFAYSVSHDLRAPLRGMDALTEAFLEDYGEELPPDARDLLARLRTESARLTQLVNDQLALARVTRGDLRREPVDVGALAGTVLAALRRAEPRRLVDTRVETGIVVNADARLMRVVLENLLGNAWKFTSHAPKPLIEVFRQDEAVCVRDNGAGFDPAKADELFQPFRRLHTREFEGTGIGLATVKRIVARHGGRVSAEGRPGEGATFRFTVA